jgi:tetratricopeptide (TPR) repeat protein
VDNIIISGKTDLENLKLTPEGSLDSEYKESREYARAVYKSAKTFYDKADLSKAYVLFEESLALTNFPQDGYVAMKIYGFLIKISSEKRNEHLVSKWLNEATRFMELFGKEVGSLNSEFLFNQGILKGYFEKHEEALKILEFAYQKSVEENDSQILSKILLARAFNSFNLNDLKSAQKHLERLEEVLHIINKSYLKGAMYLFWARLLTRLEKYEEALEKLDLASRQLQEKKCWNLLGYMLVTRGQIYKKMGSYEKALMIFELAKNSSDPNTFKKLSSIILSEVEEVNDSSIDLYLDKVNRKIIEKNIGIIDFKHRFVLLEILFLLAKNAGNYYDKHALAQEVWQDEYNPLIHDKLIYTSVSRLRKLIEPKKGQEKRKYIIRGKDGYTFNPNVKIRFQNASSQTNISEVSTFEITSPL